MIAFVTAVKLGDFCNEADKGKFVGDMGPNC